MTEIALGLYWFYVGIGHTRVDALDRLAGVLATSVPASELLAVLEEVEKEVEVEITG